MSARDDTGPAEGIVSRSRLLLVALLLVLAAVAAYGAVFAYWVDAVLLDTDTFMEAIEPIARDDGVREEAADVIAGAVTDAIDLRALAASIVPGRDLPGVEQLAAGFEGFVSDTVGAAVRTDAFENLYLGEMRRWHIKLVGAVRASGDEAVAEGAVLRVTLGPYIDLLAQQADNPIVRRIIASVVPDSVRQMRLVVFDAELVADRLELMRTLDRVRPYLPWISAAALLLAVRSLPRAGHAYLGAGTTFLVAGVVARTMLQREIARVETLLGSALSASEESAAEFSAIIFGPLVAGIDYLMFAGLLAAAVGAVLVWHSVRANPESAR